MAFRFIHTRCVEIAETFKGIIGLSNSQIQVVVKAPMRFAPVVKNAAREELMSGI